MNDNEMLQTCLQNCTFPGLSSSLAELGIRLSLDPLTDPNTIVIQAPFPIHSFYSELNTAIRKHLSAPLNDFAIQCRHRIRSHQTQLPGSALKGVKNVIAIGSGKGGVGKSTIAANLAIALARAGARVGLLDADIYGPSIPLMMGIHTVPEVEKDHYLPVKAYGVEVMSIGLLTENDPALIWRGPMLAKSLLQMMNLTLWTDLDYLLIDLPPGTGDIQLSLVQKIPLAGAVVVSTPQQVATLDAEKAIKMFQRTHVPVLGLIENMSMHQCSQCGHQEAVFGTRGLNGICTAYDVECLARFPLARSIQEQCDMGKPSAALDQCLHSQTFHSAALKLAVILSKRPLNYADRLPPLTSA